MKLLRVGHPGSEKPAILDAKGKVRDLSQHLIDFNSSTLNFETLEKLKKNKFRIFTGSSFFCTYWIVYCQTR